MKRLSAAVRWYPCARSTSAASGPRRNGSPSCWGSAPAPLSAAIAPLLAVTETLNLQIAAAAVRLARHAADDPVVRRLETVSNVGPITALSFVATLDRVERFSGPHPAATYLGLVPGEYRSGELSRRGIEANRSICRGSPGVRT